MEIKMCLFFGCLVQVGHLYVTPVGVKSSSHGNQQPSAAAPLEKLDYPKEAEGDQLVPSLYAQESWKLLHLTQ